MAVSSLLLKPLRPDERSSVSSLSVSMPEYSLSRAWRIFYALGTCVAFAGFVAVNAVLLLQAQTGPFADEGIYISSGLRTLQGYGLSDSYLTWFAGSLLAPVVLTLGFNVAGLVGARLVALVCVTLALAGSTRAARNLFGDAAGFWTAVALCVSGPTLALSHTVAYDVTTLAGIGLSFWALTEFIKRDHRGWLVLSAVLFGLGVISKYPMILCFVPMAGLLFVLRWRTLRIDLLIFGFVLGALLLMYYLPVREQVSLFFPWRTQNNPSFGATWPMILYTLFSVSFAPVGLALAGLIAAPARRIIALVLLLALPLWPLYHIYAGNTVGATKHVVFGYLFGYPLIGLALSVIARRWFGWLLTVVILAVLTLFGVTQMTEAEHGWPDVRPAAQYLVARVTPGDQLLINNSWPYIMYLYSQKRITSPWDVYDTYRIAQGQNPIDLCAYDWLVDEQGSYAWPDSVLSKIRSCGTFVQVYTLDTPVTNMGQTLDYVTYPIHTTIWHNTVSEKVSHDQRSHAVDR